MRIDGTASAGRRCHWLLLLSLAGLCAHARAEDDGYDYYTPPSVSKSKDKDKDQPKENSAPKEDNDKKEKKDNKKDNPLDNDPYRGFGQSKPKSLNKNGDLTEAQLREKTMKQMQEQQAKAIKEQEKYEKKHAKDKKPDESSALGDGVTVFNKYSSRTAEIKDQLDDKGRALPVRVSNQAPETANQSHAVELNDGKMKRVNGGTMEMEGNLSDPKIAEGFKRIDATPETLAPENERKKKTGGFFEKLFGGGQKKPDEITATAKDSGANVNLGSASGLPNGAIPKFDPAGHDTVLHRVEAELARKRLQGEIEARAKQNPENKGGGASSGQPSQPAPPDAKGEVVDLAPAPAAAVGVAAGDAAKQPDNTQQHPAVAVVEGATPPAPAQAGAPDKDAEIGPATEADIKAASDYEYKRGLASRDVVAREAAFQRAAVERREDAIPFLIAEIRQNKLLAGLAPVYLGGIGRLTPEVETTLIDGLQNKDDTVRRTCAETLGGLRSRHAVQPLLTQLKIEKAYPCRAAYVEALGPIGDRSVIPALKANLEDRSEVELVRCRTALSLSQLGDPSGRAHLIAMLDSRVPAIQVLGLSGLVQLRDPEVAGYLSSALESPYEEVWLTSIQLIPALGPAVSLPILRTRLESSNEAFRRRAALAMGLLGSDDALPLIDRAVQAGELQERIIGCELLAKLQRTDRIPLLIEKLHDVHTLVRQAAAVALAHLNAKSALPALIEAARGPRSNFELPSGLRGAAPDATEQLTILSCVRMLRGEQGDIFLSTLPSPIDHSWPELDRVIGGQSAELVKMYELVDVIPDNNQPVGAVLKTPDGKELLVRDGEPVAGGFRVRDMALPSIGKDKSRLPGYVTLMRGEQSIRLVVGRPAELDTKKTPQ